jgi:hypothetical protein
VHKYCDQTCIEIAAKCAHPRTNEAMPSTARSGLVTRKAQVMVAEALEDTRVVTINGARQSGESTLAQVVAVTQGPVRSPTLDDPVALRAAQDDPVGFIEHDGLLVIDEVQRPASSFRSRPTWMLIPGRAGSCSPARRTYSR